MGLYGVVPLLEMPFEDNHAFNSSEMKGGARSLCTCPDIPKVENRFSSHLMTVDVAVFFTGKANGDLEYSSTIVRRNGLFREGRGSLKSINMRSNDCVAFFSWTLSGR